MDRQFEQAVEIGQQNANLISLGKAWCTHIRVDRTGLGIGMVEEATGLPITGGRLTCDFARRPSGVSGMQLEATALSFYEDNCRGCTDRSPGNRVPNLGTWAEPLLAERDEWQRAQESDRKAALAERQKRADHRTLVAASLPAAAQEIVGLINRIDLDPSDADAQETLRGQALLAPDSFEDEVKAMLSSDARSLRSAIFLEVLLSIDTPGEPPLHNLCLSAVREGWGTTEGCRYLGEHGLASDLDENLIDAVMSHAAPSGVMVFRTPGNPTALLHYHSLAPGAVEQRVRTLLGHGQGWRRSMAAAASQALVSADPACGERLLAALLDGLRHHEDIDDGHRPARTIASVVAEIVLINPNAVAAAVAKKWDRASLEYRSRIIDCFESVFRKETMQLSSDVGRMLIAHAVTALSEPLSPQAESIIDDYQAMASDLLKNAVQASPALVIQQDVLIGLLLDWLERERNLDWTESADFLVALEQVSAQAKVGRVIRNIADAVVSSGQRYPAAFISSFDDLYSGAGLTPPVRAEVVRIAGRVAAGSGMIDCALPLIYTAMLGDDQSVRAAGMEAAELAMRALPHESVPPLLAQAVVAGLGDQYLIVVRAAIRAARRLPTDVIDHRAAAVAVLTTARAYAGDRMHEQFVSDSLIAAHHLVKDDALWLDSAQAAALEIVKLMPAYEARKSLRRREWLEPHGNWPDTAIHALRIDDDPQYEHLGDDYKEALLEKLGRRRLMSQQIDTLAAGELEAGRFDWRRSLLAADLFSELGRPDLSVRIVREHLASVPDTIEKRDMRRSIERVLLVYAHEEAIASQRRGARKEILERVEALCADE